jgi:hypothetical protein
MEIVLKVFQSPAGRLSGTVRAAERAGEMTFSGVMELLACIEELCARDAAMTLPSRPACDMDRSAHYSEGREIHS